MVGTRKRKLTEDPVDRPTKKRSGGAAQTDNGDESPIGDVAPVDDVSYSFLTQVCYPVFGWQLKPLIRLLPGIAILKDLQCPLWYVT